MKNTLNGYKLETDFSTASSGTARWCFANRNGKEWFVKEFLAPLYPDPKLEMPERVRQAKTAIFQKFRMEKARIYNTLYRANNGNLVIVEDFFQFGNKMYSVTEKIED
ncbi:MAG: hypothetical protein GX786_05040 [Clostridiales bacterium]|nr:hypothetical protein [Clostridiales bacterium]